MITRLGRFFVLQLLIAMLHCAPTAVFAAPGDLDVSFGSSGKVITPIGTGDDVGVGLALQPDGKIILAGRCNNGANDDFCLARYLPGGTLDPSFGVGGKVVTPIGTGNDTATALSLQPDGKIVLAGRCQSPSVFDFCLARYLASGALDTSFGSGGTVISPIGTDSDSALALTAQPDGKLVVAGACWNGSKWEFCVARYLPIGVLDPSFGSGGKVITSITTANNVARSIALQADGRLVLAGECVNGTNADFCLVRYLADGTLDPAFGSGGIVLTTMVPGFDSAYSLTPQPDGKLVVGGRCHNGSDQDFCLARYQPNGALDAGFGTAGKVITPLGTGNDFAFAIGLQPDGKIMLTGSCTVGSETDFCAARYLSSGALDPGFGSGGLLFTPIGTAGDSAWAIALQPDGKIILGGSCSNGSNFDFCLARYEGGPFEARRCTLDIDGDNQILATTDSLIHARIALGMTGSAVVSGITFAPWATRTTWPAIRDYLITQCGMSLVP